MHTLYGSHAAIYLRASTEHQDYSTRHQEVALRDYANQHALEIVAVYSDEGRSGLTLSGRSGLIRLMADIRGRRANFTSLLILDVSRWGRFQDADASAYYEYECRKNGISVVYCAEPFVNDGSLMATLVKQIKRAMAGEYSRELSAKVYSAQCNFIRAGYKQGGSAGYGLRRVSVSADGNSRNLLGFRERKRMPTDRVTYTRGPPEEAAVIHRVYAMYLDEKLSDTGIADRLNNDQVPSELGRRWSAWNVKSLLTNEKYIGSIVFNRSTQRLRSARRPNDADKWIRVHDAFEGIVDKELFQQAQVERARRNRQWTDGEMLDGLRELLVKHGKVTAELIEASEFPSVQSYLFRFDSMIAALEAAGVSGPSVSRATISRFRSRCITRDQILELERCARLASAHMARLSPRTYQLNGVMVRLLCTRCRYERSHPCWKVTLRHEVSVDFVIWIRMDQANKIAEQLYLLPVADFPDHKFIWPSTRTLEKYERYAYASMADLFGIDADPLRVLP